MKNNKINSRNVIFIALCIMMILTMSATVNAQSVGIDKTPPFQNINMPGPAVFTIYIINPGAPLINYTVNDTFNPTKLSFLSFSNSSPVKFSEGPGFVAWKLNLQPGLTTINANFTALITGNITNNVKLYNDIGGLVNSSNASISVNGGGGGPPGPGNSNYTYLWNDAHPAVNFTQISLFNFQGAPYVARGPGCGFNDFTQYNNNSMSQPGKGCNDARNPSQPGSKALDLGAVWVSQNSDYIAWNIIGPFVIDYNLSVCGGTPNSSAGYVVEFDADGNKSTGCIGNQMVGEGCYPGSDYQIWYFPDTHESLLARYNGTQPTSEGMPANSGNCTENPGEVCFVADTSVNVSINVTCNLNFNNISKIGQNGLVIVVNKSDLSPNLKLNFETNSFNISTGAAGPIDMLSDNGADKFIFMGPGADAGSCFRYDMTNQSACESNTEGFKCRWEQMNPMDPTKGACKPDFNNFNKGSACFTYNNSAECLGSTLGNCQWMNDTFAKQKSSNNLGLCAEQFRPMDFGGSGSCDTACFDCYTSTQCDNSNANGGSTYGGCDWYNDTFNPQGWCDVKGQKFGCQQTPFDCHAPTECTSANWVWNSTWNICLKDSNTEICFNGQDDNGNGLADCQDPYCKDTAKFCGANIDTLTGDFMGMNPAEAQMMKLIGMNPNIINLRHENTTDSLSPANESTELYGFSIVVANLGLGMSIDMKNGTELKACNGPLSNRKYIYMLDKDANTSTGCPITLDSVVYNGYDYMIKYGDYISINSTANNTKRMYACYNNTWTMKDATVISVSAQTGGPGPGQGTSQPLECGDPMAPPGMAISHAAIVVEKADVGNPKNDMRFLAFVVNGSWDNTNSLRSYDKMEDIYYTPGTIGFQPVDCFREPTKCGTEFMMIGGGKFMPFEDCIRPDDEDLDGFINCQDQDCINAPQCAGQYNTSNDKTAPKVKMSKIDTFENAAFAMWNTNEPTNATLKLYGNDSNCDILNATLWDEGMPNNPSDDFRPWHNVQMNNMNLGYNLSSNTTYYYILESTDMAGNPSKSTCLNFTTEASPKNLSVKFAFDPQGDPTSYMGNMTININGIPMTLGNYTDKDKMDDINITFENPTANTSNNWSIEFIGASLFQDVSFNFTDSFLANDTGEKGQLLGIENEEWMDVAQNLGIDYAILKIPSEGDTLYHCQDNGTDCMDVTNFSGVEMLESGAGYTEWKIPTTLGFSSYSAGSGENTTNYTVTFANLTASHVSANTDTNRTITMNITNGDNVSRIYNFTIEKHANTLAWLNGSTQIDGYNMSSGDMWITNLTVNANAEGIYNFNIIATLSTNSTIVLNSSDDLTITLTATAPDTTPPIITIASPANTTYPASVWFNTTLDESGSWCAYSLDNSPNATMSGSGTAWYRQNTSMTAGFHTTKYYCNDTSGNMNSTSRSFTVDTTPVTFSSYARNPSTPNEDENVQVNVTISETPGIVILEWNGTANYTVATSSGLEYYSSIISGNYTAHDIITYRWYATDSLGNMNVSATQTFTVANQAPTITTITVNNTSPKTDDIIFCNVTAADSDAEDVATLIKGYKWYDTGVEIPGQNTPALSLAIPTLDKGDIINCSANVSDGYSSSSWVNSTNSATIINTAPTTPSLSSPSTGATTTDNTPTLAWVTSTDSDSDTITYSAEIANSSAFTTIIQQNSTLTEINYTATSLADGTYYWRAKAITSDANSSYSQNWSLTIDTALPILTIASPQNTTYSTSSRWFNVTLNESGSWCAYSLNNAANITMNGSSASWYALNTSVADGHHTAVFYCNDSAGNMNATSRTFTVDATKPIITINLPENTSYSSTARTINITVTDANTDKCWYKYNSINTTITNCVNTTFTALDNQPSTLTIYANDTAGNVNSTAVVFTVDTTKPQIRINLPANTTYNSVTRTINITATDTNRDKCWYDYNSTNTTIANCVNTTFEALDNQQSNLTVYVNDTAGNVNSTAVAFTVDTLGPSITILYPSIFTTYATSSIWFNVTLDETGSWCGYSLNGAPNRTMTNSTGKWWAQNTSMTDTTFPSFHTVAFYCNDTSGNMGTTSIPFNVDTTPVSFINYTRSPSTPNEDENVQLNVTFALFDTPSQLSLEWNRTANYTVTEYSDTEYYITIISGNYTAHDTVTYRWYANDSVGNSNVSATQTFTVANQAPTMATVTVNNTSPQTNDIILCNASATDNDTEDASFTYQYKWYDTGVEIANQTSQVLALSTGTLDKNDIINCSARAYDGYSYSSWLNSTNSATIINTIPTAPVLSAPANNTNTSDNTPTFTWTASTDADSSDTVTYGIQISNNTGFTTINQSNYTLSTNTYTAATLAEGKYYWRVNATTADANTSSTTYRTFTVDTVTPAFSAPSPVNNSRINTDITLSATDTTTGLASISYSINGSANVTSGATPVTIPLASLTENITTTIDAYAQDYAGNVNHVSYTYTKDTTAPVITIISPTEDTVETTNSTILNYTVDEEPRAIWYVVDNRQTSLSNTTTNVQLNFSNIAGKHTIYVYANDSVGNLRTETTNVKLNRPFNMSNYTDKLETLLGGITANVTGNTSADITNNQTASLDQTLNMTLNMTLNATITLVTFENFNGLDADWQETFNINTTNTTVENMIKGLGTNTTKMIHIKQLERFLENGKYNGTVTFGPQNSSAYTDIMYCSDDNGQLCARISSCINDTFTGTACYIDALSSIKVHVPHFSTVALGNDTIPPVITIDEPAATETNGWNISVNATVTEDTTACNYTINSSISNTALTALSTTEYSAITTTFLPNGDYNITTTCIDAHTNRNTTSKQFTVSDTIKPVISSLSSSVTSSTATITWTTSEKADAKVNRGTTTALGTYTNNTENTTSHSVSLSSLTSSTTYYYNVTSCDAANNCNTTGPNTFTTSASSSSSSSGGSNTGGSSSGGAAAPPKKQNKTTETKPIEEKKPEDTGSVTASNRPKLIPGVGLRDNEKLQAAIEKVLAIGKLGDIAKENMIRLSASITGDTDTERTFESTATTSKVTTKMKYNGKNKAKNFVVYEKIPKTFAASSDSITVTTSGKVEVVEKDPEYAIIFSELNPGQTIEISYTIDAKADPSVIDAISSEVYAESIETPATKKPSTPLKPATGESGPSALTIIALIALIVIAVALISKNAKKEDTKESSQSAKDSKD